MMIASRGKQLPFHPHESYFRSFTFAYLPPTRVGWPLLLPLGAKLTYWIIPWKPHWLSSLFIKVRPSEWLEWAWHLYLPMQSPFTCYAHLISNMLRVLLLLKKTPLTDALSEGTKPHRRRPIAPSPIIIRMSLVATSTDYIVEMFVVAAVKWDQQYSSRFRLSPLWLYHPNSRTTTGIINKNIKHLPSAVFWSIKLVLRRREREMFIAVHESKVYYSLASSSRLYTFIPLHPRSSSSSHKAYGRQNELLSVAREEEEEGVRLNHYTLARG